MLPTEIARHAFQSINIHSPVKALRIRRAKHRLRVARCCLTARKNTSRCGIFSHPFAKAKINILTSNEQIIRGLQY